MMKRSYILSAALTTALMFGITSSLPVYAQTAAQSTDTTSSTTTSTTTTTPPSAAAVDDSKLEQFADAYMAIQALQKEAATQQTNSTDPTAAQQKQAELQGKMAEAVQKSGLEVNEFNQIAQAMVTDVDLRQRVIAKVQQRSTAAPGS